MHRLLFVKEISNSMVLGIFGVIMTFFIHFWLTYLWLDLFGIPTHTHSMEILDETYSFSTEAESFDKDFFTVPQIMILSAIFSSIDLLAVMPQVPEETYPKIS
jgi:hypothetical protein